MRRSIPYEILATVLALSGAFILAAVYYPVLNPIQFRLDTRQESAPLSRYILGTPISLLVLWVSWYFNRKAQRLKQEERGGNSKKDDKPSA